MHGVFAVVLVVSQGGGKTHQPVGGEVEQHAERIDTDGREPVGTLSNLLGKGDWSGHVCL
ncbi:MAG TPA: hypothetical protein VKH44_04675 [Pirellulaceae bacterium]|nr:hypothetical protein [Pirellulaceae bacterium]